MSESTAVAPWYRQFWFWFLVSFPLITIAWGIFMIIVASNVEDTLVTDDYSKEGISINLEIARDQLAYDRGIEARTDFEGRDVSLALSADDNQVDYDYLILNLFHPTLADRDQTIQMRSLGDGEYSGQMLKQVEGRWYYELRGPDNKWRVTGEIRLPAEDGLIMQARKPAKG